MFRSTIALLLFLPLFSLAQPAELEYPPKGAEVSDSSYRAGKYMLENAYAQIEGGEWIYADYWNVAVAWQKMGVADAKVLKMLEKSYQSGPDEFCTLIDHIQQGGGTVFSDLGAPAQKLFDRCKSLETSPKAKDSPKEYARKGGYDPDLVLLLDSLFKEDQRYRSDPNYSKNTKEVAIQQEIIDPSNAGVVGQLFKQYGYPGRKLVGSRYEAAACLIIEHAAPSLSQQQLNEYVPLMADAVRNGDLAPAAFHLLIDRLYLLRSGVQIYGTQAGIPFASDEVIRKVKASLGIE